ncbi:MAG: 5-oxoprolinase subunit PxpB [Gemmatimonadetes bacterium]|nr:5-oxoprolinase subunit PxpB [Gemmatimonadota bacterium]
MILEPLGDSALLIRLGDQIDEATHRRVAAAAAHIAAHPFPGMIEHVPAFTTIAVHYEPLRVPGTGSAFARASGLVSKLLADVPDLALAESPPVEIPVCYGGDLGPDLDVVAQHAGITADEVVRIHAAGDYRVYMIGFSPGFPFLGGLDERISAPRRSSPRLAVPAGSVAIGGKQTGVYPIETPGGWQIIGRTKTRLFRPDLSPPTLIHMGARVRFRAMSRVEFDR